MERKGPTGREWSRVALEGVVLRALESAMGGVREQGGLTCAW